MNNRNPENSDGKTDFEREQVESYLKSIIIDSEYADGLKNKQQGDAEFESYLDILDCIRSEKHADWRSDIFIPQFFSEIITQASIDASQYFQTRDYVEVYQADGKRTEEADATKRVINRTLNQRHLNNYHKFMRLRMINYLKGETYARVWWEKKFKPTTRKELRIGVSTEIDIYGQPLENEYQEPAIFDYEEEVPDTKLVYDRFNYEAIDPRNVITDNTYCYSLQEKQFVIIRSERTLDQLEDESAQFGYFNLDKLKESNPSSKETDTAKETYNKNQNQQKAGKSPSLYFDKLERFGKFWCVVTSRNADGYPTSIEPGHNAMGEKKDGAEFIECLITYAKNSSNCVLIGFQPQRCKDFNGNPYRPIIRGLHYIHPTEDTGIGDGKPAKELQVAMNDTFNLSNDRVLFATMPVMKRKKYGNEDNPTIQLVPGGVIDLESAEDLTEMVISDNIQGASIQIGFLKGMMEQALALSPSTMGMLPTDSSVSATAINGAESRTNTRSNYKSLTFENTFLCEFYWMILQLTWQYCEQETAHKLLGDKLTDFNSDNDYFYKPVSQSIETEYSKNMKIKNLITLIGYASQVPNPKTAQLFNFMMSRIFLLMGNEYEDFGKMLLDPRFPVTDTKQVEAGGTGMNNQNNVPMSNMESMTREGMYEGA